MCSLNTGCVNVAFQLDIALDLKAEGLARTRAGTLIEVCHVVCFMLFDIYSFVVQISSLYAVPMLSFEGA